MHDIGEPAREESAEVKLCLNSLVTAEVFRLVRVVGLIYVFIAIVHKWLFSEFHDFAETAPVGVITVDRFGTGWHVQCAMPGDREITVDQGVGCHDRGKRGGDVEVGQRGAVKDVVADILRALAPPQRGQRRAVLKHSLRDDGDIVGERYLDKLRTGKGSAADGCHRRGDVETRDFRAVKRTLTYRLNGPREGVGTCLAEREPKYLGDIFT